MGSVHWIIVLREVGECTLGYCIKVKVVGSETKMLRIHGRSNNCSKGPWGFGPVLSGCLRCRVTQHAGWVLEVAQVLNCADPGLVGHDHGVIDSRRMGWEASRTVPAMSAD